MELKFECPHCEQRISATSDQTGLKAPCPGCNETVVVPSVRVAPPPLLAIPKQPSRPSFQRSPASVSDIPASFPQQRSKLLPLYVVGSSALILVLLCVLIFRGPSSATPTSPASNSPAASSAQAEALNEAKRITAELEKQQQAQAELIERQKAADEQRRIADVQRQAAEERRRQEEAAQRKAEQERLALEAKRNAALARIEGLERQLSVVRQSIAQTQADQEDYTTKVKEYAMEHKMAIAALGVTVGGGAIAMNGGKDFNDDQKAVAGGVAVLGGLYAITHHEECIEVANTMAKVATVQSDYNDRIESSQRKASSLQGQINDLKRKLE